MKALPVAGRVMSLTALIMMLGLFAAGCQMQPLVDLGPNPALVKVTLNASFSPKDVQDAKDAEQLFPPFFMEGVIQRLAGPYWDWGLYLVTDDGAGLTKLPTVENIQTRRMKADKLQVKVTFQAPPGKHTYLLMADAYLEYYNAAVRVKSIDVKTFKQNYTLELAPGQRMTLSKTFGD